jgi:hypothetical protein
LFDESLSLFVSPIISFGDEYSKSEKEAFLKDFIEMDINTDFSYDLVKGGVLKRILSCLPVKYDNNIDISLITMILKRFALLSLNLFCDDTTENEDLECTSEMKKVDGYEFLFHCFNTYHISACYS